MSALLRLFSTSRRASGLGAGIVTHHPRLAVAVCVFKETRTASLDVLLVQRGRPPNVGVWSLPGGSVKFGESLHDAGLREIKEETALDLTSVTVPFTVSESINPGYHYGIAQLMSVLPASDTQPVVAGDDASDAAWYPVQKVLAGEVPTVTGQVVGVIELALARLSCSNFEDPMF